MLISQVEEADAAAPPKRARFEAAAPPLSVPAAALPPDASAVVCWALLTAFGVPSAVAAGVTSVDALLGLDDEQLVALGVQRDAVPRLRFSLGGFQ